LLRRDPRLSFSVSCTTREPRGGEVDGTDYHFITPETFRRLIEEGAFLEWADVFGHQYGTLLAPIADELERGKDVLLEVDVQGAASVRERLPDAVLIFLEPPSEAALEARLRARRTEGPDEVERRLAEARGELAEATWFDHRVVNDDVDRAVEEVAAIIDANRVGA
jgi:guanylate kinase